MSEIDPTTPHSSRRTLEQRVELLENLVLWGMSGASAVLLALGLLLPFGRSTREGSISIITAPLQIAQDSETGSNQVLIGIGFAGLVMCSLIAIIVLLMIPQRRFGHRALRVGGLLVGLLTVGALATGFFTVRSAGLSGGEAGPAIVFLGLGIVGLAAMLATPLRGLWLHGDMEAPARPGGPAG